MHPDKLDWNFRKILLLVIREEGGGQKVTSVLFEEEIIDNYEYIILLNVSVPTSTILSMFND